MAEGGNNSFAGGIRRAEEEDAKDEEREGWSSRAGLELELTKRERTERNFAFNQASNETTRLVGSRRNKA